MTSPSDHPSSITQTPTSRDHSHRPARALLIIPAIGILLIGAMVIRNNIPQTHGTVKGMPIPTEEQLIINQLQPNVDPVALARVTDPRLNEASGLVASRRNPGLYYTHNDSGGLPIVYAINRAGDIRLTIRLRGAKNVDWEDIALIPGEQPNAGDVCVADIGDNKARRATVVFYRFPEPNIPSTATPNASLEITPQTIRCEYEDGPRDAEAFAIDPHTGDGYIFSKQHDATPCRIYRLPARWTSDQPVSLKYVTNLKLPPTLTPLTIVTAADMSSDGKRLVTRSYACGWEWRMPAAAGSEEFTRIFAQMPRQLRLAPERQGEAICFSVDGRHLLTISEGTPTTLYEIRCSESSSLAE